MRYDYYNYVSGKGGEVGRFEVVYVRFVSEQRKLSEEMGRMMSDGV